MELLNGFRKFRRWHDSLTIYLNLTDWPGDVPLPPEISVVETGDGPFPVTCHYVFEPDKTIEVIGGWFIVHQTLDQVIDWYRNEMIVRNWKELDEEGYRLGNAAALHFRHAVTKVKVDISLQERPETQETDIMIRRGVSEPWQAVETKIEDETETRAEMFVESMAREKGEEYGSA